MANADIKFIDGLIFKDPHDNAPDYIIAKISIKREDLIAWLQAQKGEWINAELKKSQGGKLYAAVDEWKPEGGGGRGRTSASPQRSAPAPQPKQDDFADDDIPF